LRIRYILKNMKRSAVTNGLFCLLLIFAGALFSLAAGLWYSVYSTQKNLDEVITTIAVADNLAMRRYIRRELSDGDWTGYERELYEQFFQLPPPSSTGTISSMMNQQDHFIDFAMPQMQAHYLNTISDFYNSGLVGMDSRRLFGGYVHGLDSTPIYLTELASVLELFAQNAPQANAAFVAHCNEVEEVYGYYDNSLSRSIVARFTVEEDIHIHSGARRTRTVTGYFPYANPDGSDPVEPGKRYIIIGDGFAQGEMSPYWYNSIPYNMFMPNALRITPTGVTGSEQVKIGEIEVIAQLESDIIRELIYQGLGRDDFPMDLTVSVPRFYEQDSGQRTWFEIDGSLEEALSSESGAEIAEALRAAEISVNSLQVITSSDMNSIFRFNQRASIITRGRAISSAEHRNGYRVCVISEYLADANGLSVGDVLDLQLYPASLKRIPMGNEAVWPLNPYNPSLPVSEPMEYTIVGIFYGPRWELNENAVHANTVIIPDSSFDGFEDVVLPHTGISYWYAYNPPLLDTIIIPNGSVPEVRGIIEDELGALAAFFKFYDQGYGTLMPVLSNLNMGLIWVLILSAVGWVIALIMFSLFYVARKKREAMILNGIGVRKGACMRWILIQAVIVIIIAQCIVMAATLPVYENILNTSVSVAREFTQSYRNYTLSEMQETGGLELFLPLDNTSFGLVLALALQSFTLFTVTVLIAKNVVKHRPLGERRAEN